MADLETIAALIFDEDRIISGTFIIAGPFDITSAGVDGDIGEPVHVTGALHPRTKSGTRSEYDARIL